jgi:hypothetical protein
MLSKKEKKELLKLAYSSQIKKEFQIMKSNRCRFLIEKGVDLDKYISFLTLSNYFADHTPKPFKKIEGNNFKI